MSSIQDAYIKAFEPRIVVSVKNLGKDTDHKTILQSVEKVLKLQYETLLDHETGNLYIGKRV